LYISIEIISGFQKFYSGNNFNVIIQTMAYLTEDNSYKLWEQIDKSWESLYNLLYNDYYEGHKIGLDKDLVYDLMQIAEKLESSQTEFPQTYEQFYETLYQQLS